MANETKKRSKNMLKMLTACLIIVSMITEAPLALFAAMQQNFTFRAAYADEPDPIRPGEFFGDTFVGPPIVLALEERLAALEAAQNTALEALEVVDNNIASLRDASRESRSRTARAEARTRQSRLGAPGMAAFDMEFNDSAGLDAAQLRADQSQARLTATENARTGIFQNLLALEGDIANVHAAIVQAWADWDAMYGYGGHDPDDPYSYEPPICEFCEALEYRYDDYICPVCIENGPGSCYLCFFPDPDFVIEQAETLPENASCADFPEYCECDDLCEGDCTCLALYEEADLAPYIDEHGNFWQGLSQPTTESREDDYDAAYEEVTTDLGSYVDASALIIPAPFSLGSPENPHVISTWEALEDFLWGRMGENHHHFALGANITAPEALRPQTGTRTTEQIAARPIGRPGVFTGTFDGRGHIITGLVLRPRRGVAGETTGLTLASTPWLNDYGFIRLMGNGAEFKNVTFIDAWFYDGGNERSGSGSNADNTNINNALAGGDGNVATGSVANTGTVRSNAPTHRGIVAGRIMPNATVVIDNVNIGHPITQGGVAGAGAGRNWVSASRFIGLWNGRVGGMIGLVGQGSHVTIANSNVSVEIRQETLGSWNHMGGLVGTNLGQALHVVNTNVDARIVDSHWAMAHGNHTMYAGGLVGRNQGQINVTGGSGSNNENNDNNDNANRNTIHATTAIEGTPHRMGGTGGGSTPGVSNSRSGGDFRNAGRIAAVSTGPITVSNVNLSGHVHGLNEVGGVVGLITSALTLENMNITGSVGGTVQSATAGAGNHLRGRSVGAIAGRVTGHAHIHNVHISNSDIGGGRNNNAGHNMPAVARPAVGGLIGFASSIDFQNSTATNVTVNAGNATYVGGVAGRAQPVAGRPFVISNITNGGDITTGAAATVNTLGGGIIGELLPFLGNPANLPAGAPQGVQIANVHNTGSVTGFRHAGGIIGFNRAAGVTLTNVSNTGAATSTVAGANNAPGGIIGTNGGARLTVQDAFNSSHVTGGGANATDAGGIVAVNHGTASTITNAANTGNVSNALHAGGILGRNTAPDVAIRNTQPPLVAPNGTASINTGNISGVRRHASAGGILGRNTGLRLTIEDARLTPAAPSNTGTIHAPQTGGNAQDGNAGGIVGRLENRNVTISGVSNSGDIRAGGAAAQAGNTGGNNSTRNARGTASAGGIVGHVLSNAHFLTIDNVSSNGEMIMTLGNNSVAGGIVGRAAGRSMTITTATNTAAVNTHTEAQVRGTASGGIVGFMASGARDSSLTDVHNHGHIAAPRENATAGHTSVGGVVGHNVGVNLTILNATNSGHLTVDADGIQAANSRQTYMGGIVGRTTANNTRILTATNTGNVLLRNTDVHTHAGGVVGLSAGRSLHITNAHNHGAVGGAPGANGTGAGAFPRRAGGIVASLHGSTGNTITNVTNHGTVSGAGADASAGAGGIVGFNWSCVRGTVINGAMNYGHVRGTGNRNAGGIAGFAQGRDFSVRNAGNAGDITILSPQAGTTSGAGGIIGRSSGANTHISISFNRGTVSFAGAANGNAAGGIIGRNHNTATLTNVYNIGTVDGGAPWAGNGIIGRHVGFGNRTTIANAFVSGRVNGFATMTSVMTGGQAGTNAAAQRRGTAGGTLAVGGAAGANNRPHTAAMFTNVYVDASALAAPSGAEGAAAASRFTARQGWTEAQMDMLNRGANGIPLVFNTELITSGWLPGISSGPWRTGVMQNGELVPLDLIRTYPYFFWQIQDYVPSMGMRQPMFFHSIRVPDDHPDRVEDGNLAVMDLLRHTSAAAITYHFGNLFMPGTLEFNPRSEAAHLREIVNPGGEYIANIPNQIPAGLAGTTEAKLSVGAISPDGVVAFETGEIPFRIVVRGYDPLWGYDDPDTGQAPREFIDIAGIWLDGYDYPNHPNPDMIWPSQINMGIGIWETSEYTPPRTFAFPGVLVINFDEQEGQFFTGGYNGAVIPLDEDFTFNLEAHGYKNAQETFGARHLTANVGEDIARQHYVNVPMERVAFPVRVWVLSDSSDEDDLSDDPAAQVLPPVSHSVLTHTSNGQNPVNPGFKCYIPAENPDSADPHTGRHFIVYAMWGDTLTGTAPFHTWDTVVDLRPENVFLPRGISDADGVTTGERDPAGPGYDWHPAFTGWETDYAAGRRQVPIYDMHLYINDMSLNRLQFHFYDNSFEGTLEFGANGPVPAWHWLHYDELFVEIDNNWTDEVIPTECTCGENCPCPEGCVCCGAAGAGSINNAPHRERMARTSEITNGSMLPTGDNWRASVDKGMSNAFANLGHPGAGALTDVTRTNTFIATSNGNIGTILGSGFTTSLQGSNPYLWVGHDSPGNPGRIHSETRFRVSSIDSGYVLAAEDEAGEYDLIPAPNGTHILSGVRFIPAAHGEGTHIAVANPGEGSHVFFHGTPGAPGSNEASFFRTEWLTVADFLQAGEDENGNPVAVARIDIPLTPIPHPDQEEDPPYDEPTYVDATVRVYHYEINNDATGYVLDENGRRLRQGLLAPAALAQPREWPFAEVAPGSAPGEFTVSLGLPEVYVFDVSAPRFITQTYELDARNTNEDGIIELDPDIFEWSLLRMQHTVTFNVNNPAGGQLDITGLPGAAETYANAHEFDMFEGFHLARTAAGPALENLQAHHVPAVVPKEGYVFSHWAYVRRVIAEAQGETQDETGETMYTVREETGVRLTSDHIRATDGDSAPFEILGDITFTAVFLPLWHVTFDFDDGGQTENWVVPVLDGNTVDAPYPAPEKAGHVFVGWFEGDSETAFDFDVPIASDTTLVARWRTGYQVTFHFYDGSNESVAVPVTIGEPLSQSALAPILSRITGEGDARGWAVWGWFTDLQLDRSGRTRNGRRRPTVGDSGFDLEITMTEALFEAMGVEGNINLYAVWALWGDVNDDDAVDGLDVELLRQFIRGVPGIDIVRPAAKVTRNPDISGVDLELLRQYVRGIPGVVLGQPQA